MKTTLPTVVSFALFHAVTSQSPSIVISEISDKGTRNDDSICSNGGEPGQDWVELFNAGNGTVDLSSENYILHDNKGYLHSNAYLFADGGSTVLGAGEYMVVCPSFGIGGKDTVTLATLTPTPVVDTATGRSTLYRPLVSVTLPNTDDAFDVTYAWDPDTNLYSYTSTPTPNAPNRFTPPEEASLRWKEALAARNDLGAKFFNMDLNGYPVEDAMDALLDFHVTMDEADYDYMMQNASFEVYRPFKTASLHRVNDTTVTLWSMEDVPSGRIRPRGQSTLYFGICVGTNAIPFQLDFGQGSGDALYGVRKFILRNHLGDASYSRDWAYYHMAARFGLPYLRARHVRFFVNSEQMGLYTLLEAVDQEYVFARSFPDYNPNQYALYKVKTMALGCGEYDEQNMDLARERTETDFSTPPYSFQRGEHKPIAPVLGVDAIYECASEFFGDISQAIADSALAYLRYDESCPDMLIGEGLIDLDLGTDDYEKDMKDFIPSFLHGSVFGIGTGTENSMRPANAAEILVDSVDLENNLKMLAFYSVSLMFDTPLGNGNNYFWAESGSESAPSWKIFPWDFNTPGSLTCNPSVCATRLVDWTIARPTCTVWDENPWVGPLLDDEDRFHQYLGYVEEFVETTYGNASFVQQIQDQILAIEEAVRQDFWSFGGVYFDPELSPDAANWDGGEEEQYPFLPFMKARANSVRQQLMAMENNTFPRGPFGIGSEGVDYEANETCPDWRSVDPDPMPTCFNDCHYEGCHTPGWTTESMCDKASGVCYHGDYDENCDGVPEWGSYEGMEMRNTSYWTFCSLVDDVPTKVSMCPQPPEGGLENSTTSHEGATLEDEEAVVVNNGGERLGSSISGAPISGFVGCLVTSSIAVVVLQV